MIQPNELRVGNCLLFKGNSTINVKLDRFDLSAILYNEDEVLHYKPIELTEEILLKCGFKKAGTDKEVLMWLSDFYWYSSSPNFVSININDCIDKVIKCTYLHQLQNLYFALTGEELEINL